MNQSANNIKSRQNTQCESCVFVNDFVPDSQYSYGVESLAGLKSLSGPSIAVLNITVGVTSVTTVYTVTENMLRSPHSSTRRRNGTRVR